MTFAHPFWRAVFDRPGPVEVEIGPERGTFLLAAAAADPGTNYFGVERSPGRVRRIEDALEATPLFNARVVCGDAACVVQTCIPAASVAAYHVYFPDPWWKRRHQRRRLLTPEVVSSLASTLVPGGHLHFLTDVEALFEHAMSSLREDARLRQLAELPLRPVRSTFEKKALARSARLYGASLVRG